MDENSATTEVHPEQDQLDSQPSAWTTRALIAANILIYGAIALSVGDFVSLPTQALLT